MKQWKKNGCLYCTQHRYDAFGDRGYGAAQTG